MRIDLIGGDLLLEGLVEALGNFCGVCLVEGGLFLKFYKNTRHTAQKTFLNPTNPITNW